MTPVGNAADSRGLATCCDSVYGNAMIARTQTPFGRSTPSLAEDGSPPAVSRSFGFWTYPCTAPLRLLHHRHEQSHEFIELP
jgi:hypothetical protein